MGGITFAFNNFEPWNKIFSETPSSPAAPILLPVILEMACVEQFRKTLEHIRFVHWSRKSS